MNDSVSKPINDLSLVDGLSISQMEHELITRTSYLNGLNYTSHKIQDGFSTTEWFTICKLFHVERGKIVSEALAYYNSDRDPLTCPYHLLNVPGDNAEWGVEVKWH